MKDIDKSSKKEIILKSAADEFVEFGFFGARMQRIAERAGVNKAMLFYYYTSKEEIYKAVITRIFTEVIGKLEGAGKQPVSFEGLVRQIVDVYTGLFSQYPAFARLIQYELFQGGARIRELALGRIFPFSSKGGLIHAFIKEKMQAGEIREMDVLQLEVSIISQVIMPFFVKPFIEVLVQTSERYLTYQEFVERRKEFIVSLLIEGLKKR
ncbi:MAG: TetR family transcriptional regulator [Endomicrobiales bacterium]|nr:TetR family transcriptional regulator [Endomicrobiales bacterium]